MLTQSLCTCGAPPRPRENGDAGASESGVRFRVSVGEHAGRCGVVVGQKVSWTAFRLDGDAATVPVRKCWLVRVGEVGPAPAPPKRAKVDDSSLVERRVRAAGCFTHDLNPTPYDGVVAGELDEDALVEAHAGLGDDAGRAELVAKVEELAALTRLQGWCKSTDSVRAHMLNCFPAKKHHRSRENCPRHRDHLV